MRARTPTAFLLAVFLVIAAYCPLVGQVKDPPKDPPKDKEPAKEPVKTPEFKWPTNIDGKGVKDWLKDVEHSDPAFREFALKTLPNFGPDARKECSKKLVERMSREKDPGVRITVFETAATLGLEDVDIKPAVIILAGIVEGGVPGGLGRLHAVKTLAFIGPKAEGAITSLTGVACSDPAYETRRSIANALGQIGFDDTTGPNHKALNRLATTFVRDESRAVRMEALQSIVILGPPWDGPAKPKTAPTIDWKSQTTMDVANSMRARLAPAKGKGPGLVEQDKQIEIWCRVVLMRFDQKELANGAHLTAIAKYIEDRDLGPQLQALQALKLFGEQAGAKVDDVLNAIKVNDPTVKTLADLDPRVINAALETLASMGTAARGAIPSLEKAEQKLAQMKTEHLKEEQLMKELAKLKPEEQKFIRDNMQEELLRKNVVAVIDFIKKSKPGKPGGDMTMATPAPVPADKKP